MYKQLFLTLFLLIFCTPSWIETLTMNDYQFLGGEFQQFGIYMVSIFKGYSQPKSGKTVLQNDINKLVGSGGGT